MTASDEEIRAAIAVQAGEWFLANQAGALDAEESARFLAWLKASPVHVREYLGVARIAHHLPAALGQPRVPLETLLEEMRALDERVVSTEWPTRSRQSSARGDWTPWWRPRLASLAAALILLVAGALWWTRDGERLGLPKAFQTAHGEQRVERLPDGSVLWLDTDSEATVRYSSRERLVELDRGQALFEVAHDSQRRFRVSAGLAGAIAVGTRFDVYRTTRTTEFTVAQGEIAVFSGEPASWGSAPGLPPGMQRVGAGYQLRIDADAPPAQPVPVDLNQALGWVQHKIVFEHRSLGEVAAEFNRYGRIPVEIDDAALRALLVSGMFDAADTESFVAFLQTLPGVTVEKTPARIRVTSTRPAG